jgi:hypothetical protein
MDNDFNFTWSRMNLCFPENKKDLDSIGMQFDIHYPQTPDFSKGQISFAYKKDYGVQMFINQTIEPWLETAPEETKKAISKMHSDLSHKLYENTIKELDVSFDILEGWRKFVSKYAEGGWVGHLQNHIDFKNEGSIISLGDYYKFYINSDSKNNSPTDILHKIQKLPEDSLNDKWKKYFKLTENVSRREDKNMANEIIGKDLAECVKNADEIYKIADELRDLKF